MSDEPGGTDDRARRRMGDATKGRIADLASGWDVPPEAKGALAEPAPPPAPEVIAPAAESPRYPPAKRPSDAPKPGPPQSTVAGELPRPKGRTRPPPPPGSPRRTDADAAPSGPVSLPLPPPPGTAVPPPPPAGARAKPPSRPPPVPPGRGKPDSRPDSADDNEPTRANDAPRPLAPPPALDDSGFAEPQKASVKPDPSRGVMKRILDATPIPGPEILRPVGAVAPEPPPKRPSSPGFEAPQATVVDDSPAGLRDPAAVAAFVPEPRGVRGDPTVVPSGDDGAPAPPALAPPPPPPPPRADPSQGSTNRFERGDPTGVMPEDDGGERDDATVAHRPPTVGLTATINLRPEAMLPRKRGVLGDVRYVFTVLFGTARARRDAVTVGHAIARQLHERKQRLVALGRAAIVSERFDHPALVAAREQLDVIEEDRSHHAGALAAADDELEHVKRERAKRAKQTAESIAAQRAALADIAHKLEPLEKEAMAIRRKAGDLAEQLTKIDAKIRTTEGSLTSVKTRKEDRAGVLAEIATLKADREAVQRDEPAMAEQLDRLAPRMAGLEAKHHDAGVRITELEAEEATDQQRAAELIAAIEAKKKVVERSHGDAEARRDKALHALAERLMIDRPSQLGRAFEPIDEIDLQIATDERRAMELRELLGSVDRRAMTRGIAVMAVILAGAVAGVVLALTQ